MKIETKLLNIQQKLKVPKNQYNAFGKYKYRNLEDIQEAVKPLLKEYNCTIGFNDEVVNIGNKNYVKSTVLLVDTESKEEIAKTAYAREAETKKGMDDAQITGAASSYARKYAANGLFAIDDTKDADSMDNTQQETNTQTKKPQIKEEDIPF